ncbi:MAG: DUF5606 domain-containing protein [Bacteroidia bacterium]
MKKINVEKIIAISGTPGLFKVISNGVKGVIVENITDKKRTIVLNNGKIYSLDTIRIFINDGELPVEQALYRLYETLNQNTAPHHKTSTDEEIVSTFEKAIPEYDRDRVNISNMRKLFQWYNLLHQANMLEVKEDNESSDTDTSKNEAATKENNTDTATEPTETTKPKKSRSKSKTEEASVTADNEESAPKKRGRKKKSDDE